MTDAPDEDQLWLIDPTEAAQRQLNSPLPADDSPVRLTVYEAQKCQAIINGYLDGILGYEEGVRRVAFLLSVRALDAGGIPHAAADPWPFLDALPWPPPAGLRPQPE
jgi:hypothetical protein